jgi:hypothetical protein
LDPGIPIDIDWMIGFWCLILIERPGMCDKHVNINLLMTGGHLVQYHGEFASNIGEEKYGEHW